MEKTPKILTETRISNTIIDDKKTKQTKNLRIVSLTHKIYILQKSYTFVLV